MSLNLPSYFLHRPALDRTQETISAFEAIYVDAQNAAPGRYVVPGDRFTAPKWQFLCWLAEAKGLMLHGSGESDITEFEPRKSDDVGEFGNHCCIYAASDGLWPMFFAVVDRERYTLSVINGCFRVGTPDAEPLYYFSITGHPDHPAPWRLRGTVYALSGATFEPQPPLDHAVIPVYSSQWRSWQTVRPLLQVEIAPEDFPFLPAIRRHDNAEIRRRSEADPNGWPWADEE